MAVYFQLRANKATITVPKYNYIPYMKHEVQHPHKDRAPTCHPASACTNIIELGKEIHG